MTGGGGGVDVVVVVVVVVRREGKNRGQKRVGLGRYVAVTQVPVVQETTGILA